MGPSSGDTCRHADRVKDAGKRWRVRDRTAYISMGLLRSSPTCQVAEGVDRSWREASVVGQAPWKTPR